MKVVILAGVGSRPEEETKNKPKPLVIYLEYQYFIIMKIFMKCSFKICCGYSAI